MSLNCGYIRNATPDNAEASIQAPVVKQHFSVGVDHISALYTCTKRIASPPAGQAGITDVPLKPSKRESKRNQSAKANSR